MDRLRGIEIVMGWQFDRIIAELPLYITWTWFSLAFIWFAVVIWAGATKDWSTAMAFGQLLAASVSLIGLQAST